MLTKLVAAVTCLSAMPLLRTHDGEPRWADRLYGAGAENRNEPAQPAPPGTTTAPAATGTVVSEVSRACWYVFQARNGEYWFGSDGQGVYRYNGVTLINYTKGDGLSGHQIRGIQGDAAGNIYFNTFDGGICRFDGRAFATLPVTEAPADGGWRLNPDDLWFGFGAEFGFSEGPYRYDGTSLFRLKLPRSGGEAAFRREVPNPNGFSPYDVYSIYRDSRGHVWIGTSNLGVCRYDGTSFSWLYEDHLTIAPNGGSFGIRSVIEDKDGAFWICNTRHRFRVRPENTGDTVVYTRHEGIDPKRSRGEAVYFQGAVADADGSLWFASYSDGVWRYDGETMTNYPVKHDGNDARVVSISKDNSGGLWLGTATSGPYRLTGEAFEPFRP